MASRREFGTIFERKGSRKLYVRFPVGRGRPPVERPAGTTREIAKSKLRRVQHLLDQGAALERILHEVFGDALPESITFREAVDEYIVHARLHRKASTVVGYERLLGVVNQASWTEKPLSEIVAADITRWLDGRARQGLAPQTLNNGLTVCSAVFRWAQERGLVEGNPVRHIRRIPNKGRGREVYLTAEECRSLVAVAVVRLYLLLMTALNTGMRRGELLGLRWQSVDLDRGTITVESEDAKSGRSRTIPMNRSLHAEMAKHALSIGKKRRKATSQVFAGPKGEPYTASKLRDDLLRAVNACDEICQEKKPSITCHVLRHTAASLMVAAGVPIFDVSKILGHSSVTVTMRYAHFAPEAGRAAVDALGKILDLGQGPDEVRDRAVGS